MSRFQCGFQGRLERVHGLTWHLWGLRAFLGIPYTKTLFELGEVVKLCCGENGGEDSRHNYRACAVKVGGDFLERNFKVVQD